MKKHHTLLALSWLLASALTTQAQLGGDPTMPPTGVPTRTMKTLDQVEARTPLVDGAPGVTLEANGGFTISTSGSYYLARSLAVDAGSGVAITSSSVTLDLNGFYISHTGGDTSGFPAGVFIAGVSNVTVKNGLIWSGFSSSSGTIIGNGFDYGVIALSGLNQADSNVVKDLTVVGSGSTSISNITLVEDCLVRSSGGVGISGSTIINSIAENCEGDAIIGQVISESQGYSRSGTGIVSAGGVVANSHGESAATSSPGSGISAKIITNSTGIAVAGFGLLTQGGSMTNSSGTSSSGDGIRAFDSTISNSVGKSNSGIGINGASESVVSFSRGDSSSGTGIDAFIVIGSTGSSIVSTEDYLGLP